MARPAQITRSSLTPLLQSRAPISATELATLLRTNRTTIVRHLPDFGDELVTLGATRSTRYLLRRQIRQIGNRWPVYRLDEQGRASQWAELEAMHDRLWRVSWAGNPPGWAAHFTEENGLWSGFPFFLSDSRPQGFLGRIISRELSRSLQLPENPAQWSDEDTLIYLQAAGEDLPGNLVLGDECLRRALARSADLPTGISIGSEEREASYPSQAQAIARNPPRSSAGGEQPKFLATLRTPGGGFQPVLVKFSAPMNQPTGRRWADLLLCEYHAHRILAGVGLAAPGARLMDFEDRRFLEVPRFDRSAAGGRLGTVSLQALAAAAGLATIREWTEATSWLARESWITAETAIIIHRLSAFGELIGNSDMHSGNLSFFLDDALPFRITPSYDMLPMHWSPGPQGEFTALPFAPLPPLPAMQPAWHEAAGWAEEFWEQVSADPLLSPDFAVEARQALEIVRRLRQHVG